MPTKADRTKTITYPVELSIDCRKNPSVHYYPVKWSDDVTITRLVDKGYSWIARTTLPTAESWVLIKDANGSHDEYHLCYKQYGDGHREVVCTYMGPKLIGEGAKRGCEHAIS